MGNVQETEQTRYNLPKKFPDTNHEKFPKDVTFPPDSPVQLQLNADMNPTDVPAESVEMGTGTDNTKSFGDNYQVDMIDQPSRANRYTILLNNDMDKFSGIANLESLLEITHGKKN